MDNRTIAPPVGVSFVVSHARLGGAERYLELLLDGLGPDWIRSTVCLGEGPFVDRLRCLGHSVTVVRTPRRIGMLAAAWKLRGHLRRQQPDVVHANGTKAALVCGLAALATGIPVIWVKHDHFRDGWLTTLIALRCRQVVGVSAAVNAGFPRMLRNRLHVVHNGVPDLPVDREAGRTLVAGLLGCGPDTPVVLLVGRLDPLKGAGELLQAAPQVLRRRPDVRFALLGGEESHHPGYRCFLERRAEDLGIRESLAFLDHRDDAVSVLSGCDVAVIPSIPGPRGFGREGFPLVAIEALWVGTPIVGYAAGGLPEAVADCARLVAPGDRAALAEGILEILENPAMREQLVACGMERARARYRFASVVERMAERYRAAVTDDTSAGQGPRMATHRNTGRIEVHSAIAPLAPDWDDLVDRTGTAPFTRPGWLEAWWRACSGGRGRLEILALRRQGRLAAVMPLVRHRGLVTSTTSDWMSAYDPPAEDLQAAGALADALFASRPRRVEFRLLPLEHAVRAACRATAGGHGYRIVDGPVERSPYVALECGWESYQAGLDRKLLSEVRRRRRRLEEQGSLSVEVLDGRQRLDELLDEGFRLEAAAWKGEAGTAIISDPATVRFFRDGADWASRRGILRLAFLRLDGRPLAFDYCLEEAGVHYLLKIGYDPAYRKYGPGVILRHEMLQRAFSAGLSRYEFLGIDMPFKLEWTQTAWEKPWLRAFAPSLSGSFDRLQFTRVRPRVKRALGRA